MQYGISIIRRCYLLSVLLMTVWLTGCVQEELFKVAPEEKPEYNGIQLINSKVIVSYLKQLLRNDLQYRCV